MPYFKSCCRLTPPDAEKRWPRNGSVSHDPSAFESSKPGPLQISWPNWAMPLGTWAREGMKSLGIYPTSIGFNSGKVEGSGWVPGTIDPASGHRSSSQTSFLSEALKSTSLKVYTRTMTTKITFDTKRRVRGGGGRNSRKSILFGSKERGHSVCRCFSVPTTTYVRFTLQCLQNDN